jgi:predicted component of type VI protein secretion system
VEQLLSLREIRAMARSMPVSEFREQLGPLALVQRPRRTAASAAPLRASVDDDPTSVVDPRAIVTRMVLMALDTENLNVATLPPLRSADELLVGRQPDCDLVLDHDSVSKRHALLRWHESKRYCTVQDFGSTNGTFVNMVTPIKGEVIIYDGDVVSFGTVAFWFALAETLHAKLTQSAAAIGPGPQR